MRNGRLTAILVAALVSVLVGGGTTAYLVGRERSSVAAAPTSPVSTPAVSTPPASTPPASTPQASTSPGSTPPLSSAGTDVPGSAASPPAPGASGPTTRLSPTSMPPDTAEPSSEPPAPSTAPTEDTEVAIAGVAADDPQAEQIRSLLQRHFDSINYRDYAGWAATVTSDLSDELPEKQWLEEYSTTRDTDINIITIRRDPREVNISFRSRQDKARSPEGKFSCLNWQVKHPLTDTAAGLRIERSIEGDAIYYACSGE